MFAREHVDNAWLSLRRWVCALPYPHSTVAAASFEHDGALPRTRGLPGWHVKPLLPSRRTTLLPRASVPMIRAKAVTCHGLSPAPSALLLAGPQHYRPRGIRYEQLA